MATSTTTFETIRDQWISIIEALTPAQHSSRSFSVDRGVVDFQAWAEENPQAAFRRFAAVDLGERADPSLTVSDLAIELVETPAEIVVAYPHGLSMYGTDRFRDLQDMMRADANQIRRAIGIGGAANYVSGQCVCDASYTLEDGEVASFVRFNLLTTYYYDAS